MSRVKHCSPFSRLFASRFLNNILTLIIGVVFSLSLSSCGGSDSATSDVAESTLSGTVATGAAFVGTLNIMGSIGNQISDVTIVDDGFYSVNVDDLVAPFILQAIPSDSSMATLYSYAASANSTVNVTQLTTLAIFIANGNVELDSYYTSWASNAASFTQQSLLSSQAIINSNLSTVFQNNGLDATSYDFFSTSFIANGSGIDGVLDSTSVNLADGNISITVQENAAFNFDLSTDVSAINIGSNTNTGGSTPTEETSSAYALANTPPSGEAISIQLENAKYSKSVFDFTWDPDGIMWMATGSGLVSFDGTDMTIYDSPAVPFRSSRAPAFHSDGSFTMCSYTKPCMTLDVEDASILESQIADVAFTGGNAPTQIIRSSDGDLWVARRASSNGQVLQLPGGDFTQDAVIFENPIEGDYNSFNVRDQDSRYFYGWVYEMNVGTHLVIFDTENETFTTNLLEGDHKASGYAISAKGPGDVWAVVGSNLQHWNGSQWSAIELASIPGGGDVDFKMTPLNGGMTRASNGNLWIMLPRFSPPHSLAEYDGSTFTEHVLDESISAVDGMFEQGPDGLLYFGSRNGLNVFNPN
ncbi:MAG TPA: hypothetical protein ENJ32_03665 [Crenotrichaceae bacterium]|nr:hypothetical protein [Crenotrichaceae bacterium]